MKVCTRCKIGKRCVEFRKQAEKRDGLSCMCKECMKIRDIGYRKTTEYQKSQDKYHDSEKCKITMKKYLATLTGRLRRIFTMAKQRCNNPKENMYYRYGGRGIQMRFNSASEFVDYVINELGIADISGLEIDRVNNDGHYEKGNIRFVTHSENCSNRG